MCPVIGMQPVQGAPCLLPEVKEDSLQHAGDPCRDKAVQTMDGFVVVNGVRGILSVDFKLKNSQDKIV